MFGFVEKSMLSRYVNPINELYGSEKDTVSKQMYKKNENDCGVRSTHCRSCRIADMTPPERSEWTVTEASKRQFGAALWPPGMRVLWDVCAPLSLRRASSCLYGFKMISGRGLCIEFLFLRHGFYCL